MKLFLSILFLVVISLGLSTSAKSQSLKLHHGSSNIFEGQIDESGQAFVEFTGPRGLPVTIKLISPNRRLRFLFYEIHGLRQYPNRTQWTGRLSNNVVFGITITGRVNSVYKLAISAK